MISFIKFCINNNTHLKGIDLIKLVLQLNQFHRSYILFLNPSPRVCSFVLVVCLFLDPCTS